MNNVTAIAAGDEFALARLSNGTVMSWGSNANAQLGVPAETRSAGEGATEEVEILHSDVPLPVQQLSGVTAIAAGDNHALALLGDGEVSAWGANGAGQLGNGTEGGTSNLPTAVPGLSGVKAIAAGAHHSLALLSGGSVLAWGYNPDGQLGNASNLNSPVPVAVKGIGQVADRRGRLAQPVVRATTAERLRREPGERPAAGRHVGDDHGSEPRRSERRALRRDGGE